MLLPGDKMNQQGANVGLAGRSTVVYYDGAVEAAAATDNVTILLHERSWIMITDGTFATNLTLPSVSEAAGMTFFFYLITTGGQDVVITDGGDDSDFDDVTLANANDRCIIMSDGIHWFCMDGGATAPA